MRARVAAVGVVLIAVVTGCTLTGCEDIALEPTIELPPAGAAFDYQLGGTYVPRPGTAVVARDSTADPAGTYAICYVNGFQTQPSEGDGWLAEDGELVLRDAAGDPFVDPGWPDEYLLDTSTAAKRDGIAARLEAVISSCATDGFDAVEIDNLDSWSRSGGALTFDDNVELAVLFARTAHDAGLAIAQKNGAGDSVALRDRVGFDFAVTEQCMLYEECADYLDAYDGLVFDIEYDVRDAFAGYCKAAGRPAAMILRDLDLTTPASDAYLYETC